jgi:hypothetical protein
MHRRHHDDQSKGRGKHDIQQTKAALHGPPRHGDGGKLRASATLAGRQRARANRDAANYSSRNTGSAPRKGPRSIRITTSYDAHNNFDSCHVGHPSVTAPSLFSIRRRCLIPLSRVQRLETARTPRGRVAKRLGFEGKCQSARRISTAAKYGNGVLREDGFAWLDEINDGR